MLSKREVRNVVTGCKVLAVTLSRDPVGSYVLYVR